MTYVVLLVCLSIAMLYFYVKHPEMDEPLVSDEPIGQPPKLMGFICHDCGEFQQVMELTDETVGTWGEKMKCSACRQKGT